MPESVACVAAVAPVMIGESNRGSLPLTQSPAVVSEPTMDVGQAVSALNEHFSTQKPPLTFHTSRSEGDLVVTVIDTRDNRVLRQMPSDEALSLARKLAAGDVSLMTKQTA